MNIHANQTMKMFNNFTIDWKNQLIKLKTHFSITFFFRFFLFSLFLNCKFSFIVILAKLLNIKFSFVHLICLCMFRIT